MRINNNVMAINSHRQYGLNIGNIGRNVERLSSGFRINRAADDAAGLAISEKMRTQIRGLNQASRNTQDGVSLIQVTEGALGEVTSMMQRIRELAVQGANGTNDQMDRDALALEVFQIADEIRQTGDTTQFNGINVLQTGNIDNHGVNISADDLELNGRGILGMIFQVGANAGDTLQVGFDVNDLSAALNPYFNMPPGADGEVGQLHFLTALSYNLNHVALALQGSHGIHPFLGTPHNYSGVEQDGIPSEKSQSAWISHMITQADYTINVVSMFRANLGAIQNRLEHKMENLNITSENLAASESRIRDADMAQMMTDFTRNNILMQSSTAMLAQANALPQSVLQLVG